MFDFKLIFQILAFLLVVCLQTAEGFLLAGDACSFDRKCSCTTNRIDCSYRYLTEMSNFTNYNRHADYIGLNFNFITSLPANAFATLFSASSRRILIRLDHNRINTVDANAFTGLPSNVNVDLYLNDNNLQTIPTSLEKIPGLYSLYIQNNPLTNIDVLTTLGPSLRVFSVSFSKLQSWPSQLQNLTNVSHLTLDKIPFKTISSDALKSVDSLTSLTITDSELAQVPDAICLMKDMQLFYFSNNKNLNSSKNLMVPCPGYALNYVSFVDLSNNDLSSFPNVFDVFPSVKRLQLIDNDIHYIDPDMLPHNVMVERLYMGGNKLKRIPGTVSQFSALNQLFLANNDIATIEDCDLPGLHSLEMLDISNNPLEYISKSALKDSHLLNRVELGNTNLRKIPIALSGHAKLSYLNTTGSPIECDCSMAFLRAALPLDIQGSCVSSSQTINDYISSSLTGCP